ncbi:MAG: hypothetical protein D6785_06845 [Planctomycetota bacterium]|nr:MAG: hypothetical protein D6785_06845 [Planctomycetota bacterium]
MTWIQTVPLHEASGTVKREYENAIQRTGKVAEIVQAMSINSLVFSSSMRFYKAVMFAESPIPRKIREMIATFVSSLNHCHY